MSEETITLKESKKAAPPSMPKIVVCPNYKSLSMVKDEFVAAFGAFSVGVCLITLEEAIRLNLPLRKAIKDYSNKTPNDVYLVNTVKEMIPEDYKDSEFTIDVAKLAAEFSRVKPQRNEDCPCGSKLKYKKCCLLDE